MISDDLKDDDIIDDDFDIDDFEDEDWDSEDEDLGISDTGSEVSSEQKDKTFLQKFFIPIVIAIFGVFGAIFLAGQGFLGSGSSDVDVAAETVVVASPDVSAPQQSSDMANTTDDVQDLQVIMKAPTDAPNELSQLPETTLRPLPGDSADQQLELVDLEAELRNAPEAETLPIMDEPPMETLDISSLEIDDAPLMDVKEPMLEISDIPEFEIADIPAEIVSPIEETALDIKETLVEDPIAEEPFLEEAVINEAVKEAVMFDNSALETEPNSKEDVMALEKAIDDLKSENENLNQNLINNEAVISGLNSEVESLKAMIEELKLVASNQNKTDTTSEKLQKTDQVIEEKPAIAPKKAVSKTKPSPRKAVKWVLKSAQPGKATISRQGSNDLKSVEIGSVVAGIGRVTDVSLINGAWVVKGTRGSISR
ncbi:MAG: hypothetical protein AB8B83_01530 [Bdellovibrionales bacterium]